MDKTQIQSYWNRFDASKNVEEILFRDGYGAQASEHNELQGMVNNRIRGIADALFKNGDIIRDAQIVVNAQTGEVQAGSGAIYLNGAVRSVGPATFNIPTSGSVAVGVRLIRKIVTEEDDPSLYNPAVGSPTHGQPGAWRERIDTEWGFEGDGKTGDFYVVHVVDDGVVRSKEAPPNLDSFNQGIARYDRDSTGGGTYVVSGLTVRRAPEDAAGGAQIYTVAEGRARVHGYGIELATSRRLSYNTSPDLRYIDTEVHTADGSARQRIDVAHAPIYDISLLRVTLTKTETVTHGSYAGCSDALRTASVVAILECRQGDTVFVPGTDYVKTGDSVDWKPLSNEPATGSTYTVKFTHMAAVTPVDADFDGFTVEGAVAGSSIILSYNQALPRLDRLCVTSEGAFVWQQGVASEYNPQAPVPPEGVLALATVYQTWRETRQVINDGVRVIPFSEIEALNKRLDYVLQEIARQRLESDVSTREDGARVGIFVDPLLDDSNRDQGISQTAAIFGGELTLSIKPEVFALAQPMAAPATPPFTPSVVLSQPLRTGSMKVNPYMAFDPLPARVTLNPAVDQWTDVDTKWTSPATRHFNKTRDGYYHIIVGQEVTTENQVVDSNTSDLEFLRQIPVEFEIQGFGKGEILQGVTFDGVPATYEPAQVVADNSGVARGKFTIPKGIPAGAKTVTFRGAEGGNRGSAVFVGQGKLTVQTLRQVNTITTVWVDPLAQTFVLDANTQLCGVDIWFTAKGGDVRVQIREVQNGVPTRTILAEAFVPFASIVASGGGHTRATFPVLVQLLASTEYAVVVLCDDAETSLAIAEMGEFDKTLQKLVTSQPYTVGVLLSSSNASTWTAHQDKDMAFRLLEANFTEGVQTVEMGSVEVAGTTDIVVLALDETPTAATRVEYEVGLPGGASLLMAQGQPARLAEPVSGAVTVKARLSGTKKAAPLLWPGAQLLTGEVSQSDDYYSRSIPAIGAKKAVLIYDAVIPSGATVTPAIQIDSGEWKAWHPTGTVKQGDGVVEYSFDMPLTAAELVKLRFVLTGTSPARPCVRKIRFMAIK